jgi:acetyl-CoA acetyltransferase
MSEREVFVVGATRTAIGGFGGSLKDVPLSSLATTVVRAALERAGTNCTAFRGRHALATMCIGGGQGIAAIFERG